MASIVVTGDTSGAITIAAPAVAGTNTLTLPASTGTLVVTGGAQTIEFADGSAAAPSITNSGDTNTGMFFPAADTIAFTEGGVEAMRLDASGNLLVGQTTAAVETGSIVTAKNLEITRTVDSDGAALGQLSWVNNTNAGAGSGTSFVKDVACIKGIMDGTGNNSGGYITFETKADAGSRAERMRILANGDIQTKGGTVFFGASSTADIFVSPSVGNMFIEYPTSNALVFRTQAGAESMRLASNGDVYIARSSTFSYANGKVCIDADGSGNPGLVVGVSSTSSAYNNIVLGNSTGGVGRIQTNGSATAYLTSSDYRLKKDVTPIENAIATIQSLNPVAFTWNVDDRQDAGFLAHEFQEILPNYADGTKDGVDAEGNPAYQAVDKSGVIPFLVKAIQELNAKVEAQAVRIAELEGAK